MDREVLFEGINLSTEVPRAGQSSWRFPSRQDYIQQFVQRGVVADESELLQQPQLITQIQSHWHSRGQNGCNFAKVLSKDAPTHGWGTVVVPGGGPHWDPDVVFSMGEKVRDAIANPRYTALSLVFPEITGARDLVNLIHRLAELPDWSIEATPVSADQDRGSLVCVLLRVRLSWDEVISWVLGFGPFEFLPLTRQAPFTEVALAVKPKNSPPRSPRLNADLTLAHLADVPLDVTDSTFEKMLDSTAARKRTILGKSDDPTAKAKVTYVAPSDLWSRGAEGLWLE